MSSRSRSSHHSRGELMSITVRKEDRNEKAGIRLEQETSGRVKVRNIAKNGLFGGTDLEIGDFVLSINCVRLSDGEPPEALVEVINKADRNVTIVVKKMNRPQTKPNEKMAKKMKKRQAIKEQLLKDNNQAKPDTYYGGLSKRNEDGSLNCKKDPEGAAKKKKPKMTVTVSALKEDREDAVGVEFVVQSKKLFVSYIHGDSIFGSTDLAVGDCVLSINDMSFREYVDAEYAVTICAKARAQVTLVVIKNEDGFTRPTGVAAGRPAFRPKAQKPPKRTSSISTISSGSRRRSGPQQGKPLRNNSTGKFKASYSDDEDDTAPLSSDDSSTCSGPPSRQSGCKIKQYVEKSISVPKGYWKQDIGVEFLTDRKLNMIYVHKIMDGSIFEKTSLEEGDYVLTINDVCFRSNPDRRFATKACMQAKESVNLVILKEESTYLETAFNLDQSASNLDWMV